MSGLLYQRKPIGFYQLHAITYTVKSGGLCCVYLIWHLQTAPHAKSNQHTHCKDKHIAGSLALFSIVSYETKNKDIGLYVVWLMNDWRCCWCSRWETVSWCGPVSYLGSWRQRSCLHGLREVNVHTCQSPCTCPSALPVDVEPHNDYIDSFLFIAKRWTYLIFSAGLSNHLKQDKPSWCVASQPGQLTMAIHPWVGTAVSWIPALAFQRHHVMH